MKGLEQDVGWEDSGSWGSRASPFPSVPDASWRCRMDLGMGVDPRERSALTLLVSAGNVGRSLRWVLVVVVG